MKKKLIDGEGYITLCGIKEILTDQKKYEKFLKKLRKNNDYTKYFFFDGLSKVNGYFRTVWEQERISEEGGTYIEHNPNGRIFRINEAPFGMFYFCSKGKEKYPAYFDEYGVSPNEDESIEIFRAYDELEYGIDYDENEPQDAVYFEIIATDGCSLGGDKLPLFHSFLVDQYQCEFNEQAYLVFPKGINKFKSPLNGDLESEEILFFLKERVVREDLRKMGYELKKLTADEEYKNGQLLPKNSEVEQGIEDEELKLKIKEHFIPAKDALIHLIVTFKNSNFLDENHIYSYFRKKYSKNITWISNVEASRNMTNKDSMLFITALILQYSKTKGTKDNSQEACYDDLDDYYKKNDVSNGWRGATISRFTATHKLQLEQYKAD